MCVVAEFFEFMNSKHSFEVTISVKGTNIRGTFVEMS